jgi:hypothetical protein
VVVRQEPCVLVVKARRRQRRTHSITASITFDCPFFCRYIVDGVEIIAAKCRTMISPGFDEATGEKLAAKDDTAA